MGIVYNDDIFCRKPFYAVHNPTPADTLRDVERYRDLDYTEGLPPDRSIVLEEQLADKERDRRKRESDLDL